MKKMLSALLAICLLCTTILPLTANAATEGDNTYTVENGVETIDGYAGQLQHTTVTVPSSYYPESSHNYADNLNQTKTFTWEGAAELVITFNSSTEVESNYDCIYLYDGDGNQIVSYTGTNAANETVTIPGDTFMVRLTSDVSVTYYGYAFSSIVAAMHSYDFDCSESCNVCGEERDVTHNYDNDCDADCNVCGEERDVTHSYDNDGDSACNNCGARRHVVYTVPSSNYPASSHNYADNLNQTKTFTWEDADELVVTFNSRTAVESNYDYIYLYDGGGNQIASYTGTTAANKTVTIPGDTFKVKLTSDGSSTYYGYAFSSIVAKFHLFDNDGDATCNECSYTRTGVHIYDNDCDTDCNVCGQIRTTSHSYDNDCDTDCNICGQTRTTSHIYDNDCDADCNICGQTRTVSHDYDNWYDMLCNTCSEKRQVNGGDGWQKHGDNWYFGREGYWVTGLQLINSQRFYFDDDGVMQTGWHDIGTRRYFFDDSGVLRLMASANSCQYEVYYAYPESDHPYANDLEDYQEFTVPGALQLSVTFSSDTYVEYDYDYIYLYEVENDVIYYYSGSDLANRTITVTGDTIGIGLSTDVSGEYYGYSITSIKATFHTYTDACDRSCNRCGETRSDIHVYDSNCDPDCNLCGATRNTSHQFGDWYDMHCDECGLDRDIGGVNGWNKIDGKWYYGIGSRWATGWKNIASVWYYFNADGVMQTGWVKLSNIWYYMNSSGAMVTGWQKLSGYYYFFDRNGCMYENRWYQSGSTWYYLKPGGIMATGAANIDGTWYKFSSSGAWIPGTVSGWINCNGAWHYIVNNRAITGWKQLSGKWYYFNASGVMQTGWIESGSIRYYLTSSGAMATTWCKINGDWYYFNASGIMQKGWKKISGKWYHFGTSGIMKIGSYLIDGEYYRFRDDGSMVVGWYKSSSGSYYYYDQNGCRVHGEKTIGGKTYYFDYNYNGMMRTNTWYRVYNYPGYNYYYFGDDGAMVKSKWMRIGGYEYYFDSTGKCDRTPIGVNWY